MEEADFIRVYTMEPREKNKANIDVIRQISRYYGVSSTILFLDVRPDNILTLVEETP